MATSADNSNWREVAAVILLPFGGVIIPVAGWFVGVFFLWVSDAWTGREKLVGTLIIPGGLLVPFMLLTIGTASSGQIVLLSASFAAPLSVASYLALRLRRR